MRERSGCRRPLASIALAFGATFACLLAVEVALARFRPIRTSHIDVDYHRLRDDDVGYEPRPSAGPFNADGIRADREYAREKPEGVVRIVVLGDSLAYGLAVPLEETWPARLERALNDGGGPPRYEVLNLGVVGYRTAQVVARLREKGLAYDPDWILYQHWLDDVHVSDAGWMAFAANPARRGVLEAHARRGMARIATSLLLYSQIGKRLLWAISSLREPAPAPRSPADAAAEEERLTPALRRLHADFARRVGDGTYRDPPGFEAYYAGYADPASFRDWNRHLAELGDLCRAPGRRCLLLLTPVLAGAPGEPYPWSALHAFVAAVAAAHGLAVLDLTGPMRTVPPEAIRIDVEHPNGRGNAIVAREVEAALRARGAAPG